MLNDPVFCIILMTIYVMKDWNGCMMPSQALPRAIGSITLERDREE